MSSAITNAGEALIALHQNRETGLIIDKFILANIPGVDPAAAVDRTEGKPVAENIVYEYAIPEEGKGYINPNQVVYSMLLGSDIGDFEFNWLGLYSSADDTVVAITYCPTLAKWKTAHPTMGNALTRNFMLEYSGLQATTQITVEASTWQIDFTTRQKGIDERERLSNRDIYGGACFFGDGYLIVNEEGSFTLQPGTGYVEGIRIDQVAKQDLAPTLPAEVFLDVALQPQGSDRLAIAQIVYADPGDYTDGTNDTHYGQKIAEIDAGGVVTDCRPKTLGGELGGVVAKKDHLHPEYENKADAGHVHTSADIIDLPTTPKKITHITTSGSYEVAADTKITEIWEWGAGGSGALETNANDAGGAGSGAFGRLRSKALKGETLSIHIGAPGAPGTTIPGHDGGDTYVESPSLGELGRAGGGKGGAAPRSAGGIWTDGALVPVFATNGSPGVSTSAELVDVSGNFYHQGGPAVLLGGVLVSGGANNSYSQGGSSSNVASFTSGKQGKVIIVEY